MTLLLGSAALVAANLPALVQASPESLLPPGFNDPVPAPAPAPSPPPAATPSPSPAPSTPAISSAPPSGTATDTDDDPDSLAGESIDLDDLDIEALDDEFFKPNINISAAERRSLAVIGPLVDGDGGLPQDAFGNRPGRYLTSLIDAIETPLVSRWAHILLRRTLLSRVDSPAGVDAADWVAVRAWRLLRMGEADAARLLITKVDAGNFSPVLYKVAMEAHLATADPAGLCRVVPGGAAVIKTASWEMFKPICASLSGEQQLATSLLNRARDRRYVTGIDYLLAEKLVGAGFGGRRAVTVEWEQVDRINNWRFGLAMTTGVTPPRRLLDDSGRHVRGWLARAPMLTAADRLQFADSAAGMGVLSNKALVDLYSMAYLQGDGDDALQARISLLQQAYLGDTPEERVEAMQKLWDRSENSVVRHGDLVLTARAAARIPPAAGVPQKSRLIASMLTAGLDRNAARWAAAVDEGSSAWAQIMLAAPKAPATLDYDELDSFYDNDESEDAHRSALFLAGIAGLERATPDTVSDFADRLDINLSPRTRWTRAIDAAAGRGEQGTVAILAALALRDRNWSDVDAYRLYHVVSALRRVGLEPEARMIAAEAIARS